MEFSESVWESFLFSLDKETRRMVEEKLRITYNDGFDLALLLCD